MKKLTLSLVFVLGCLGASPQFYSVDMCPGEMVTINLTVRNVSSVDLRDAYLQFRWKDGGEWLLGGEEDIWIGTIPSGQERTLRFVLSSDPNEPGDQRALLWYWIMVKNGEVWPGLGFSCNPLPGPGPANLLSATPLSSREINLTWEATGNQGCCAGYYAAYRPEGQADFILNPQLIVGATNYTLEVPYPSTEYELRMVTANYDGEPTELVSNSLFATTHPYLSSRTRDALDPSNGSKFLEKGDKVYLVHEDQDKVWLITGKKDPGKGIAWDQREYLLSDLLPRAWDPCIGLLETTLPWDTMLFCAFAGRVPQNAGFWPPDICGFPFYPLPDKGYRGPISETRSLRALPGPCENRGKPL